jgi:membrane associated rhomboid family serine protease
VTNPIRFTVIPPRAPGPAGAPNRSSRLSRALIPLKDNLPTARFPIVTVVLIALNVAAFVWQLSASGEEGSASSRVLADARASERDQLNFEYGAIPSEVLNPGEYCAPTGVHGRTIEEECGDRATIERESGIDQAPWWLTLLTSMFMHGGILHIAFNMLFLWVFGNNIEDAMGRLRFVAFYLLAGVVATYAQALVDPDSVVPQIGASGAVAGVLGGYALLHPRARVLTLVFIVFFVTVVEIPAMVMLGIWFVLQFVPAVADVATPAVSGEEGGVAYLAHVGGFVFGLALIKLFAYRRDESGPARAAF